MFTLWTQFSHFRLPASNPVSMDMFDDKSLVSSKPWFDCETIELALIPEIKVYENGLYMFPVSTVPSPSYGRWTQDEKILMKATKSAPSFYTEYLKEVREESFKLGFFITVVKNPYLSE